MKIPPKKSINVDGQPAWHAFKLTFILNRGSIRPFIQFHSSFYGKFVFNKLTQRLAAAFGEEDKCHSAIAGSVADRVAGNPHLVGAEIEFKREGGQLRFELEGASGSYGRPSRNEMKMVAEYIADLISASGLVARRSSIVIKFDEGNKYIITAFLD